MKAVRQHVHGKLVTSGTEVGLILYDLAPAEQTAVSLYLRFAFVTLGREEHIFPAFILDDWGKEIRGAALYDWMHEFGSQFPRGEIFGFTREGEQVQLFVRELELYFRLPCYAYSAAAEPVSAGQRLHAILLPDADVTTPQKIKRPSEITHPLQKAAVSWWQIPTDTNDFHFLESH